MTDTAEDKLAARGVNRPIPWWIYPIWRWSCHFSRGNLHKWIRAQRRSINGKVLNVGAGGELAQYVGEAVSIDIDSRRGPNIVTDVCDLRGIFDDDTFDAIFLLEVLEHVREPQLAIAEIYRILKPGGKIVMSAPYIFEMHDVPFDFWRFTEYGLNQLLYRFKDIRMEKRNGYFSTLYTPLIRLLYSPYPSDRYLGLLFSILALPFYPLIFVMDTMIRSDYLTTAYHVTAIKPHSTNP